MDPAVSIVVPTYNEEQNLPRLLASIGRQEGTTREVIVVDQQSSDRTRDVARSYGCDVIELPRPAFYTPPGRNRNFGAERATGNVVLNLDADMELPTPDFLSRVVSLIDDDHQAVIVHEVDVADGFWSRCKALERACYRNTDLEAARGATRSLFSAVGGYDEAIGSGEDIFISRRYADHTQIASADDLEVLHHTGRQTLRRLLSKKFNYGRSAQPYLQRSKEQRDAGTSSFLRQCLHAYLSHAQVARQHPLLYAAIFPLRALEMAAVTLGIVAAKLASACEGRVARRFRSLRTGGRRGDDAI